MAVSEGKVVLPEMDKPGLWQLCLIEEVTAKTNKNESNLILRFRQLAKEDDPKEAASRLSDLIKPLHYTKERAKSEVGCGFLPILRSGSIWSQGECVYQPDSRFFDEITIKDLDVDRSNFKIQRFNEIFEKDNLEGVCPNAWGLCFEGSSNSYGKRILIPCSEIFRVYYGLSNRLTRLLLSNCSNPFEKMCHRKKSWRNERQAIIYLTEMAKDKDALALARFVFFKEAEDCAMRIFKSLAKQKSLGQTPCIEAFFPFSGKTTLTGIGQKIEKAKSFSGILLHVIESCSHPIPLDSLIIMRDPVPASESTSETKSEVTTSGEVGVPPTRSNSGSKKIRINSHKDSSRKSSSVQITTKGIILSGTQCVISKDYPLIVQTSSGVEFRTVENSNGFSTGEKTGNNSNSPRSLNIHAESKSALIPEKEVEVLSCFQWIVQSFGYLEKEGYKITHGLLDGYCREYSLGGILSSKEKVWRTIDKRARKVFIARVTSILKRNAVIIEIEPKHDHPAYTYVFFRPPKMSIEDIEINELIALGSEITADSFRGDKFNFSMFRLCHSTKYGKKAHAYKICKHIDGISLTKLLED
jgi:hypothetical protein